MTRFGSVLTQWEDKFASQAGHESEFVVERDILYRKLTFPSKKEVKKASSTKTLQMDSS